VFPAIEGLTDAELSDPSLAGWSVMDHLAHLAWSGEPHVDEIARIPTGHETACRLTDEQAEALNTIAHQARRGWLLVQARAEFERSGQRVLEISAAVTPRGFDGSRYGEATLYSEHAAPRAAWIWQEPGRGAARRCQAPQRGGGGDSRMIRVDGRAVATSAREAGAVEGSRTLRLVP